MLLFNKLPESDRHNVIHYCLHIVVEDMLEGGVEIEPFSDADKTMVAALEKVVEEAEKLPEEERFIFVASHEETKDYIFDIALDMARSAYYSEADEMVIDFEDLREEFDEDHDVSDMIETVDELVDQSILDAKDKHSLN